MKLWGIFRFELAYQVRRPWPWLFFAVVLVVDFLLARDSAVADALYEDFFVNSSFAIATTTVIGTLLWFLVAPVVAGEAGARDVATGMYPLTYTAPISKTDYLGGRFLAALLLNALILLAVPVGILLAVHSPGVNPEVIGPFRLSAYLTAYAFIALPNAFVATALQFSLAVWSGRPMVSYLGSMLLLFMGFFVATVVRFFVLPELGSLLDPVGINFIVEDLAHQWTTAERQSRVLALEGTILQNRLLWVGVALTTLAILGSVFRFAHRTETAWWTRWTRRRLAHAPPPAGVGIPSQAAISVSPVPRMSGFALHARQTLAIAWTSFRTLATSWAGLGLLVAVPMMTVVVVLDQMVSMGTPLVPTTAQVLRELTGGLSAELASEPSRWVILPLFVVFFAGELRWRERDAGLSEITDAMPGSEWAPFLGKLLGLGFVLVASMATLMAAGMVAQILLGHHDFAIGLYVRILFGLQLPEYLLFGVLALVVHAVVDQKYVGHLLAILAYAWTAVLATALGIEHNLLVYGAGPGWSYTEMRGFGPFVGPWLWFQLYWAAWALLLAVVARLLWMRGKEGALRVRIQLARRRFAGPTAWVAAAAVALALAVGGFLFYNTNILHEYRSTSEIQELRAEYERRYRQYESIPQPRLTRADLRVEIYPERRAVAIRGSYRLVNESAVPIDSIHVATGTGGVETGAVTFDRATTLAADDEEHGYRIYALEKPLEPGGTVRLDFEVHVEPHGFGNRGVDRSVVENGTYFTSEAWFPFVGYQRQREILSPADRRSHGLAPRPVLSSLYEVEGDVPASRRGGVAFDAVVGTDEGQVAVAPGALRRTWSDGAPSAGSGQAGSGRAGSGRGRRYFHYAADAPIGSEWAFFSARYAVHEERWSPSAGSGRPSTGSGRDVEIRIFHHPEHTAHLDRMMRSVRASLDYYSAQFGPYPYGHLSLVEQPAGPGTGAHADASLISYGQGVPFWIPRDERGDLDVPFFVVAHEMAHEWTVPYALVEGLPFLAEGLATYSAIQVVKESLGGEQLRELMAFLRRPYPYRPMRRGEPLLQALDPYLSRRKGPFAMVALTEYVGTDPVNGAIRRLVEKHDVEGAPPATTLDLYRELQAVTPDALQYLLHDLFEVNTLWVLETEGATAAQTPEGTWQVTLHVRARKRVYDVAGVETDVPMDESVQIGVFGFAERGAGELSAPLYVRMHRIRTGTQTITVTVPGKPDLAGIDPYHLLDWEEDEDDDNIEVVEIAGR